MTPPIGTETEAHAVAQLLLDATARALMEGDFDSFVVHFRLPNVLVTPDGARVVRDRDGMRTVFENITAFYRDTGVVELDRRVEHARHDGTDTIRHIFTSRLVAADGSVTVAYPAHSRLERQPDGRWLIASSHYTLNPASPQSAALLSAGDDGDAGDGLVAESVLQGNLDRLTRAYMEADFSLALEAIALPLFKQGIRGSQVFATEDDLRRDFDAYLLQFRSYNVTDLVRTVKSAAFLGEGRVHGTYRTHVLSGARLLMPSYVSAVTLDHGADGMWRMSSIMHPTGRLTLDTIVNAGPAR